MHSSRLSYSRAHHKRASGIAVRDNDILDGLLGDFTKSASTTTQSFILPGTTILRTQVVTLEVPVTTTSISLTTPTTTLPSLSSSETSSATSSSVPSVTDTATSSSTPSSTSTSSNTTSETASDTTTATTTSVTQTLPPDTSAISTGSSSATNTAVLTSTFTTSSSTATSGTDTVNGSLQGAIAQSHGLSGGAVAGIVIAILFIILAVVVYFVRKRFLRRRKERRNTWGAGLYPKPDLDFSEKLSVPTRPSPEGSRYTDIVPPPMGGMDAARPSPMKQAQPLPAVPPNPIRAAPSPNPFVPVPAPPPMAFNNLPHPAAGSPAFHPIAVPAGVSQMPVAASDGVIYAYVRCTFIPGLPDELSITTGETVRVLSEYDDGWVLCTNGRGERGVVPLECLQRQQVNGRVQPFQPLYPGQGTGDWRMSKRGSSLYQASNSRF